MERVQVVPATAAEETMALYDACWFHRCVLLPSPPHSSPPEREADNEELPQQASSSSSPAAPGLRHRRTRSDEATSSAFRDLAPLKIPNTNRARLETILSGKDGMAATPHSPPDQRRRPACRARRRNRRRGRSMSELEFEELKGLQDLGFTFSDAEVDAELASIVPGLRRKRSEEVERPQLATKSAPEAAGTRTRPYLSEAWEDEEEEVRALLRNWRIPPAVNGAGLKEHLRVWAHTVASAVR